MRDVVNLIEENLEMIVSDRFEIDLRIIAVLSVIYADNIRAKRCVSCSRRRTGNQFCIDKCLSTAS